MQSRMNLKIKFRESFRPFAPLVLTEATGQYFDFPADHDSPYMLIVAPVRATPRAQAPAWARTPREPPLRNG